MIPVGRFRNGLLVTAPIMNASGRSDTALMNALINGMVQIASYDMAIQGKDIRELDDNLTKDLLSKIKMSVLGDDSLTIIDWFENMDVLVGDNVSLFGFEARDMKVRTDPRKMVFLGNRLYPCLDGYLDRSIAWGPTIGRRVVKLSISTDKQPDDYLWLKQVSEATLSAYPFVPVLSDISKRHLHLLKYKGFLKEGNSKRFQQDYFKYKNHMLADEYLIFDEVRICSYLNEVYGVSLSQYSGFLKDLSMINNPTTVINYDWLERVIDQDTG